MALIAGLVAGGWVHSSTAAQTTYSGTLSCEASSTSPPEPAFLTPVVLKVDGSAVSWTREAAGMRETVSGQLADGAVVLDGYGGNVSAATRQAFWDWKIKGRLIHAGEAFSGPVQLLSKDGRAVLRQCAFATAAQAAPDGAAAPASIGAVPAAAIAPAQQAAGAATSSELQRREDALAARERALALREQQLATVSNGAASASGTQATQQAVASPTAGSAASANTAVASAAAVLGSIAADAINRRQGGVVGTFMGRGEAPPMGEAVQAAIAMESGPMQGGPSPWPTKAAFLGAARRGQLLSTAQLTDGSSESKMLVSAVSGLLGGEYGVPRLPGQAQGCTSQYSMNVMQLLKAVTERELSSLTDQPPTFRQAGRNQGLTPEDIAQRIQAAPNCDLEALGMRQAHPYKQALLQLAAQYTQATRDFVQAEAQRRASAYEQRQTQLAQRQAEDAAETRRRRDVAARQDAALRAAEQRRIDEERARIEAEEKRRQEINRTRVGG